MRDGSVSGDYVYFANNGKCISVDRKALRGKRSPAEFRRALALAADAGARNYYQRTYRDGAGADLLFFLGLDALARRNESAVTDALRG